LARRPATSNCRYFEEGQEFIADPGMMRDPDKMITCCTDGIRPVFFRIERVDDQRAVLSE
jgi:hypothetical protein